MSVRTLHQPTRPGYLASQQPCIEADSISVAFGEHLVVDSVSLSVPPGEIFGLIGPSGCGKTTIVKTLVGLLRPSGGRVEVLRSDPVKFSSGDRRKIGYTPQGFNLYPTLTVSENANFVAALYGMGPLSRRRRVREVLTFLEVWGARKRLARDISGGMQRRLSLACALLHRPSLLFVDEPTAGLDPVLRAKIWDHLALLRDQGTAIFVTTQYIDEATNCDRVGIMRAGKLLTEGKPHEIREAALGGDALDVHAEQFSRDDVAAIWSLPFVQRVEWINPGWLRVQVDDIGEATPRISALLMERGLTLESIHPHTLTFEDVFLAVVGASK